MSKKNTSIKSVMLSNLKTRFGSYPFFAQHEANLAVLCSDIPEVITDKRKDQLITVFRKIKSYLIECEVHIDELQFLDDEIERYRNTHQICLYNEEEDYVSPLMIDKYSQLSIGAEGVIGIHLHYTFKQIKKLTDGVYNKTGLIKFYISREKKIYGKIIAEVDEHVQKIPIASLIESRKIDKETGEPLVKRVALFGEKIPLNSYTIIKEIEAPFYIYRFISEENQEMIVLTHEPHEIGDYIIEGMSTQCNDYKMITDSAKLPTKLPFFFSQTVQNRIIKYDTHDELFAKFNKLNITKDTFYDYPFTVKLPKIDKYIILKQPQWFKDLIWAWLLHASDGLMNSYPLHIMIIGPPGSGKSMLLNGLHSRSKETKDIFSGSGSTFKRLIPSFKTTPAKMGYLAESSRFSYCDEFLRCVMKARTSKDSDNKEEMVALMNDLLEHQKREAGSGISSVKVSMTARMIATTNPVRDVRCVEDILRSMDGSFLSRILLYKQCDDHVNMIRQCDDEDLEVYKFKISNDNWVSILDYLHSFSATYDKKKVRAIYKSVMPILSENLKEHYESRHKHHISCIMDGIIKSRCMFERDIKFTAKEIDYTNLEIVWKNVIRSWIDSKLIKSLPVNERIFYLPENAQWLYWKIVDTKKPINNIELKDLALTWMSIYDYRASVILLIDNEVATESEGVIRLHYMKRGNANDKQQRL